MADKDTIQNAAEFAEIRLEDFLRDLEEELRNEFDLTEDESEAVVQRVIANG